MKAKILLILAVLISTQTLPAQSVTIFDDAYPGVNDVLVSPAGEVMVLSHAELNTFDPEGGLIWHIDLPAGHFFSNIFQADDGSWRLFSKAPGGNPVIWELDPDGSLFALVTFTEYAGILGVCAVEGGFMFTTLQPDDVALARIDQDGELLWIVPVPVLSDYPAGKLYFDGTFAHVIGFEAFPFEHKTQYITFDTLGNTILDTLASDGFASGREMFDDGFVIIEPEDFAECVVQKYDQNADLQWSVETTAAYEIADTIAPIRQLQSGNYAIAIPYTNYPDNETGYFMSFYSETGDHFIDGPHILKSSISNRFVVKDFMQIDDSTIAFVGKAGEYKGFVSITDTLGYVRQLTSQGRVYADENGNGHYDSGELVFHNTLVYTDPESAISPTSDQGKYTLGQFADGTYSTQIVLPPYFDMCTPVDYTYTLDDITTGSTYSDQDFILSYSEPFVDVQISASTLGVYPGETNPVWIFVENIGNQTINGQEVRLHFPSNLSVEELLPIGGIVDDTTITWTIFDLKPGETLQCMVWLHMEYDPDLIGDVAYFNAEVDAAPFEDILVNNTCAVLDTIDYPCDPNHIVVVPEGDFHYNDQWLQYTIEFQNTGTAPAMNITVVDTLDAHLNLLSLKMLGASAEYTMEIKENDVIFWHFYNINLPDSSVDLEGSTGMLAFRIQVANNIAVGNIVHKTAGIYFDLNDAVWTNTTANTYVGFNTIEDQQTGNEVQIFPNPARSFLNLILPENEHLGSIQISDVLGRIMYTETIPAHTTALCVDVSELPAGMYILRCSFDNTSDPSGERFMLLK